MPLKWPLELYFVSFSGENLDVNKLRHSAKNKGLFWVPWFSGNRKILFFQRSLERNDTLKDLSQCSLRLLVANNNPSSSGVW